MRRPFFSGNYGSALGDTRTAANLIAQAGATEGRRLNNLGTQLGRAIGGAIEKYQLNKEKRNKLQATLEGQLSADPSIVQQLTMTGDEEYDKKNMKLFDKVQSGDASIADLERANGLLAGKTTQENSMMKKSAFQMSQIAQQLLNENRRLKNKYEADTLTARVSQQKDAARTAQIGADYAGDQQSSILAARNAGTAATIQRTKQSEESFPLEMEYLRSQIRSKNILTGKALMDAVGIQGNAPADLDKRFSEIATQLDKIDNTRIKVKTSGLFGGEEKEVTFKEFNENPDNYAPVTSDRIKALNENKDRLIKEQTEGILNVKIPAFDPDTGESIFITLRQKMEYDEARRKKREEEERASQQANQINVRSQLQGVRN